MSKPINNIALFRLTVLGPLASRDKLSHGELKKIISELAQQSYVVPGEATAIRLGEKTIERWYYLWLREGVEGLTPKTRCDKGNCHLPQALQQAILQVKQDKPTRSINTIIQLLERQGLCAKGQLSKPSVHRLLQSHQLSKRTKSDGNAIERRAFEAPYAGDIWYGDVMHGPRINTSKGMRKTYLVSLSDDASRLICHSAFYFNENVQAIEGVFKEALLKRGLPKKLVIDNGAAYRSLTLQAICARLKVQLIYCKAYEPEGKAKLERWHRTVREQFLTEIDNTQIDGLSSFNARLWAWIEQVYHHTVHSSLVKSTPIERWQRDLAKIQPLGEIARQLDAHFYHRHKRTVRKDGSLSFGGQFFEVPYELSGKKIYLVVDPQTSQAKWVEDMDYEYLGPVHLLDKVANAQRKRQRPTTGTPISEPKAHLVEMIYSDMKKQYEPTDENS